LRDWVLDAVYSILYTVFMVLLEHVTKTYHPHVEALKDLSFKIEPGEFVSIVGRVERGRRPWLSF
jgi:ABC-type ATPase involved in cell division